MSHCTIARLVVSKCCYHSECPLIESDQQALRKDRTYLERVVGTSVLTNSYRPEIQGKNLRTHSKITSIGNKKQQEAVARKEIAKRQKLRDELESDSSSDSEVHYNIEISDKYPVVTTRAKYKAQEAATATVLPPQPDEGSDEAESDGNNPATDNAEEGNGNVEEVNDDAEESGDDDTEAKKSGDKESAAEKSRLNINEKRSPNCSIQEEPKIHINALNEVPKLKILFEGYNMYWMAKTLGKYNMEWVRAIPVDISKRTITRVLMGGYYKVPTKTIEYDYRMRQ
ncbi:hypothetical protein HAX54_015803 [Datura stramonium]|uniref:Uncharacterized protein n=1 Tax=Datura stramonium TaxID=4076 RepID=A0ABS8UHQ6_DATST|nr:hypothetical protein [Datura stramonium]